MAISPTPEELLYPSGGGSLQRDDWQSYLEQLEAIASFASPSVVGRSGNATLTAADSGTVNRCTTALTLTLPVGSGLTNGWPIKVLATSGAVTLATQGADTVEATTIQTGQAATIYFDGAVFRVRIEGAAPIPALAGHGGKLLRVLSDASGLEWFTLGGELVVVDQKAQNTAGGGFTNGAWRQRELNTVRTNTISGASLAANRVTLPAGTYKVQGSAPALAVQQHLARIYNVTDSAELLRGTSEYSAASQTRSIIDGNITLAGTTLIECQHLCAATAGGNGLGVASNLDGVEVYTQLRFERLA